MQQRSEKCGTTCLLNRDPEIDHCAYCRVEEGMGPYQAKSYIEKLDAKQSNNAQIKQAMTVLKELFGEKQYNLLYSIIKKADSDFHQLVFGDNWSADDIEDAHNSIQTLYLMMETIE